MAGVAIAAVAISSCDNDAMNIGQSLTNDSDRLNVADTTIAVDTRTIVADSVFTLSSSCYFGRVIDPETGAEVKSEFTTQFHILETMYVSPEENIVGRYNDRAAADSCDIIVYLTQPFNTKDSLSAIKVRISELETPMAEGQRYYSNYNPASLGMLSGTGICKDKMCTFENLADTDSARATSNYYNNFRVVLNDPFTDKDGNTYNNYGTYILQQYYNHPEYFKTSQAFARHICPGLFFEITDGLGFHAQVWNLGLRIFYRVQNDNSTSKHTLTLAGTQEVLQTTLVTNDKQTLMQLKEETTHTYLKSPAGLFTEVTLPVNEIKKNHTNDSLIGSRIVFQRINNESTDNRKLGIPQTLLIVERDSLYTFFENTRAIDNRTTFTTTFDIGRKNNQSTKLNQNVYVFENISNLITNLWNKREKGLKEDPAWESKHPNWNKVVLVPVTINSSRVEHDMSLTSTRLVGGKDNPYNPVTISVVYAKFK
ncbi:MAG: DUF4270 domain-containing protein [Prevotella sp.]|nr:DUF4270 domain-containing protein [Prevotella sp.]